jgi:hypothetical protein
LNCSQYLNIAFCIERDLILIILALEESAKQAL